LPDPSKTRHERRARARSNAATITVERRSELAKRAGRPIKSTGTIGGVSLPIEAEFGPKPFMTGPDNDWLFPVGCGKDRSSRRGSLPRELAPGGWIFLRSDDHLVAKVLYLGAEMRSSRREHIPSPSGFHEDAGEGYVLVVDPATWTTRIDHHYLTGAEMGNGYRYYATDGRFPVFVRVDD
jgi:hypothetical protein